FRFPQPTHTDADNGNATLFDIHRAPYSTAWDALRHIQPDSSEKLTVGGKWGSLLPSIPEGENYLLFEQISDVRDTVSVPLIIMGYLNPMMQYGIEAFCKKCQEVGIDGLIIPDMPVDVYHEQFQEIFEKHGLINVFLITPQTSEERIRFIDSISNGFIYMVSSAGTTGAKNSFGNSQETYFDRIGDMQLKNPRIVGFGISNHETFAQATNKAKGAIIGSAFIKHLTKNGTESIEDFVNMVLDK
ncbi:MAG: tryptophan synthase subunit alpha, partial [Bacteroidota bacterium]